VIENRSAPGPMIASLCYEDLEQAIVWLDEAFGFVEQYRYGPPDGIAGAQLQLGEAVVMLFDPRVGHGVADDFVFRAPRRNEATQTIGVRVEDVDAHHERARAAGGRILLELQTYEFGERQYSVEDFAGHLWTFSQSVADVAPESWGARTPD
jgi:uncharacterized glyoxalase superfamily protein PhnB